MQFIKIECFCGRQANLSSDKFGVSHDEFKVDKVAENLMNLKCRNCHKSAKFIFNEKNQLLFDLTNLTFCKSCETPVSFARLKAVPGTSLCTFCAQEGANDPKTPPPHPQPPSEFSKCPTCKKYGRNSRTEMRQNSKDKSWFIGCSSYPKCNWTKNQF